MRLLKTGPYVPGLEVLESKEFSGKNIPSYAILSHTWGESSDEVLFADIQNGTSTQKRASSKLLSALKQARNDGHGWLWIDTCCIDKDSSAELSEAINSMYAWYHNATKCYAYLSDVPHTEADDFERLFCASKWFTRGWTLQELLAPRTLEFYCDCLVDGLSSWSLLGDRFNLQKLISKTTGINIDYLTGFRSHEHASVATRMSWAALRETTREEDKAYCLMGLFSVNMPMLYGEGDRAFIRLQEEIMKHSDDQSLFAWTECEQAKSDRPDGSSEERQGLLATHPAAFATTQSIIPYDDIKDQAPFVMTNRGLSIDLHLIRIEDNIYAAALNCHQTFQHNRYLAVYLEKLDTGPNQYARVRCHKLGVGLLNERGQMQSIYIRQSFLAQSTQTSQFFQLSGLHGASEYELVKVYTNDLEPGELQMLPNDTSQARSWVPSEYRTIFKIPSGSKRLAVGLMFRRRIDSEYIWVLLGSITDFDTGFSILQPEEKERLKTTLGSWFSAKPLSEAGDVMEDDLHYVQIHERSHVYRGQKFHVVDISISAKPEKTVVEAFLDQAQAVISKPGRRRSRFFNLFGRGDT